MSYEGEPTYTHKPKTRSCTSTLTQTHTYLNLYHVHNPSVSIQQLQLLSQPLLDVCACPNDTIHARPV